MLPHEEIVPGKRGHAPPTYEPRSVPLTFKCEKVDSVVLDVVSIPTYEIETVPSVPLAPPGPPVAPPKPEIKVVGRVRLPELEKDIVPALPPLPSAPP